MGARPENYIPAAGRDWLLPLYDPVLRLLFNEQKVRGELLAQAAVRPGHRVRHGNSCRSRQDRVP